MKMPETKRFAVLRNAALFLAGAARSVYWLIVSFRIQPEKLVIRIRSTALKGRMIRGGVERLTMRYKAADFMLRRILHAKSACLARSFAVYEYALRMGLYARLCISNGEPGSAKRHT